MPGFVHDLHALARVGFILLPLIATGAHAASAADGAAAMGFFVTSRGAGNGANLGGLAGADRHCQALASEAGAGARTWRAYLSAAPAKGQARVDARDRIGNGPWANAGGVVIARDVEMLHSDLNRIDRRSALDEHGRPVADNQHDILTGSDARGRLAFAAGVPATCANWTRNSGGVARLGHHDAYNSSVRDGALFPHWDGSWNSRHDSRGCSGEELASTGSGGLLYCFAADAPAATTAPPPKAPARYSYRRGVNVNHWLGNNLAPELLADALYGADWFDGEDVAWIAAHGFDHVRILVNGGAWVTRAGAPGEGRLDEAALRPFDAVLRWARENKLGVVLAMHGFPGYRDGVRGPTTEAPPPSAPTPLTDAAMRDDAVYLWWLVARRYADVDDGLRFELIDSPDGEYASGLAAANTRDSATLAAFNHLALSAVRRTNPTRMVYLSSPSMAVDLADEVDLADPHTALSLAFQEPEVFTWQLDPARARVRFPGRVPDLGAFATPESPAPRFLSGETIGPELLDLRIATLGQRLRKLAASHEIYMSTLSVYRAADDESARRYLRSARPALEREGFAWAVYDYHTGGAIRGADGRPTRVLEGLGLASARAGTAKRVAGDESPGK